MKMWGVFIAFYLQNKGYIHSPSRIENKNNSKA